MREFTFDLTYEPWVDELAGLFAENEDLLMRSLNAPAQGWYWRLTRATGPATALEALEEVHSGGDLSAAHLEGDTELTVHHDTIERAARRRVIYSFVSDPRGGTVHGLIAKRFGPGVVVETVRQGDRQHWRLLLQPGKTVGEFHDELVDRLHDGVSFQMCAIRDATTWREQANPGDLPEEQRRAVRAAVEAGYYESPRAATLDEIADTLGIPRSTLSYRLRKAEAHLARAFATAEGQRVD
jgi:predicted DNA binding protein